MRQKVLAAVVALAVVSALGACKKEEERPITGKAPGGMFVAPVSEVRVSDSVKEKWAAVKLTIEDKDKNETSDIVIGLGAQYAIPGSELKVEVGEFLPDFRMEGPVITSASESLNNPAVHVKVYEGDEELFDGWLYSKFPSIHPFMHEKYGITLTGPVEKG